MKVWFKYFLVGNITILKLASWKGLPPLGDDGNS